MSLKQEIDKYAEACNQCMADDPGSINKHLDSCPSCKDYNNKIEELNEMVQLLKDNAGKPPEERYNIIKNRIEGFLELNDMQRKDAVGSMLDAMSELSENDRVTIVTTRMDILMNMPREQRNILLETVRDITPDWTQERADMEMRAVNAGTQHLMPLKRALARRMFSKALEL